MKTSNKRLIGILCAIPVLLSIPLIAMQFGSDVYWTLSDFIIMGLLLLITGLTIEFALRKAKTARNRFIVTAVVLFIFFLIWAELAVGIFGSPFAGS